MSRLGQGGRLATHDDRSDAVKIFAANGPNRRMLSAGLTRSICAAKLWKCRLRSGVTDHPRLPASVRNSSNPSYAGCGAQNIAGRYLDLAATNCGQLGKGLVVARRVSGLPASGKRWFVSRRSN
jgi:hypothetical protein